MAKLDTYDVKAEKIPVSAGRSARSMTWAGLWSGIAGRASVFWKDRKYGGIRELTKRFTRM